MTKRMISLGLLSLLLGALNHATHDPKHVAKYTDEKKHDDSQRKNLEFRLSYVIDDNDIDELKELLKEKVKIGSANLHFIFTKNRIEMLQLLLEYEPKLVHDIDQSNQTTLMRVVNYANGNEDQLRLLLRYGARKDINKKDNLGNTALTWAVINGDLQAVQLLVEEGAADICIKNNAGRTPLEEAEREGHTAIARYLASKRPCHVRAASWTANAILAALVYLGLMKDKDKVK